MYTFNLCLTVLPVNIARWLKYFPKLTKPHEKQKDNNDFGMIAYVTFKAFFLAETLLLPLPAYSHIMLHCLPSLALWALACLYIPWFTSEKSKIPNIHNNMLDTIEMYHVLKKTIQINCQLPCRFPLAGHHLDFVPINLNQLLGHFAIFLCCNCSLISGNITTFDEIMFFFIPPAKSGNEHYFSWALI